MAAEVGRVISLGFDRPIRRIACLGAHPDDIEIGAAATLSRLAGAHEGVRVDFLIATGTPARQEEAERSAAALLGTPRVVFGGFDENHLPYREPSAVKAFFADHAEPDVTDVVFAPARHDLHQDHRFVGDLAGQLFRNNLILRYEIPKQDGDFGQPNAFVSLTAGEAEAKLDHLDRHFASQHDKAWYGRDLFAAVMRVRGMEARSESGYAEAFYAEQLVIG